MNLSGLKVLVTGGAGFIGSHLTEALLLKSCQVTVIDDLSNGKLENLPKHENLHFVEGSILDQSLLERHLKGIDAVFHLACLGVRHSIHSPFENHRVNAEGTLKLLMASRQNEIKRFLYCSSSEIYGTACQVPMSEEHPTEPHTVYGASKLVGEKYALAYFRTYQFPTLVVRPFNTFGPRSHHEGDAGEVIPKSIIRALADHDLVVFGDGSQTRDFTYVEDTASGLLRAIECDALVGEVVNLGSNYEISIQNLCETIVKCLPKTKSKISFEAPRPGDVLRLYADPTKMKGLVGWQPEIGFDEGLKRTLAWFEKFPIDELIRRDVVTNWQ